MFDVGFSELLLLGVVALIVLGPERLPVAMRTLGRYYAKCKRLISTIQDTVNQELKLAELREQMQQELENIRQTELRMKEELAKINLHMQSFDFAKLSNKTVVAEQDKTTVKNEIVAFDQVSDSLQDSQNHFNKNSTQHENGVSVEGEIHGSK